MCKCHNHQKPSAITALTAIQHGWQAELSSSWVSSFTIWLWSHFNAGHSYTKKHICSLLQRYLIFTEQESKLRSLCPPPLSTRRQRKKILGDCTKTNKNSVCAVITAAKTYSHRITAAAVVCVCERGCDTQDGHYSGECAFFYSNHWSLLMKPTAGVGGKMWRILLK